MKLLAWGMGLNRNFITFNLSSIPHSQNYNTNLLDNVASKLIPSENFMAKAFSRKLI